MDGRPRKHSDAADGDLAQLAGPTASWIPDHLADTEAWVGHIPFAFWIVEAARPRVLVELGTQTGNSFMAMCQAVKRLEFGTACFAVDTWAGDSHTGAYDDEIYDALAASHDAQYGAFSRLVRSSFANAVGHFADGSIDLLHIDGLHTYEAVREDFTTWRPKLSERAIVLMHDTNVREEDFGVWRFWNEVSALHPHFVFLHSHGLGVLGVGKKPPERVASLFAAAGNVQRTQAIREHFWRRGEVVREQLRALQLKNQKERLAADVAYRDAEIQRISAAVAFRDAEITRISAEIGGRDLEIAHLKREVAARDRELARQAQAVAHRDAELTRLGGDVAFRDAELQRITGEVGSRDLELRRLAREVALRDEAVEAMVGSKSWRWTAPLRRAYPVLRSARYLLGRIPYQSGKAFRHWRAYGLRAMSRRAWERLLEVRVALKHSAPVAADPMPLSPLLADPMPQYAPLISVVMPVYDVAEQYLRKAIESVRTQRYGRWELCIADDASTKPHVRAVLAEYVRRDPRIKVVYRSENGHISAASNSALDLASGEFVGFLDHDDELTPDALLAFVRQLDAAPDTDVLYSDLALVGADGGGRVDFIKPDWSPEFFRGVMYVGHLLLVRRTLLDAVGRFDGRFDGVQDFELMLRLSERTDRIAHVREVLYLWRGIPGSIASGTEAKPDAGVRQVEAVNAHLARVGLPATAVPHPMLPHRLVLVPKPCAIVPHVSIVLWCRDREQVRRTMDSVGRSAPRADIEWILVGLPADETQQVGDQSMLRVPLDDAAGHGQALHRAAGKASGDYLVFLDSGLELSAGDLIGEFVFHLDTPGVGAVGPMIVNELGAVLAAGFGLLPGDGVVRPLLRGQPADGDGYFGALACTREVSALSAACMGVRREVYTAAGGFDRFLPARLFDVDLCLRMRALGRRNLYVSSCRVVDCAGVLEEAWPDALDLAVLADVWQRDLAGGDPYYDPRSGLA